MSVNNTFEYSWIICPILCCSKFIGICVIGSQPSTKCPTVIGNPGSVCPSPIPPTPGQPCTLPGELDCHYEPEHNCCGNCNVQNLTISCVPDNSTTGVGLWQMTSPPCPADCCGSEGGEKKNLLHIFLLFSSYSLPQVKSPHQTTLTTIRTTLRRPTRSKWSRD